MSDRIVWTDQQYSDVLYCKTTDRDHRARLAVGLTPLDTIIALDDDSRPSGEMNTQHLCRLVYFIESQVVLEQSVHMLLS